MNGALSDQDEGRVSQTRGLSLTLLNLLNGFEHSLEFIALNNP